VFKDSLQFNFILGHMPPLWWSSMEYKRKINGGKWWERNEYEQFQYTN